MNSEILVSSEAKAHQQIQKDVAIIHQELQSDTTDLHKVRKRIVTWLRKLEYNFLLLRNFLEQSPQVESTCRILGMTDEPLAAFHELDLSADADSAIIDTEDPEEDFEEGIDWLSGTKIAGWLRD